MNIKNQIIHNQSLDDDLINDYHKNPIINASLNILLSENKNLKNNLVNWLLKEKDKQWLFGDNNGINFLALAAIAEQNLKLIDGKAIASALKWLTSSEEKEGGPYYCSKRDKHIDLGINILIGYFLYLENVDLPSINELIEKAIEENNFPSEFITDQYILIDILSRFYKGDKRDLLISYLKRKLEEPLKNNHLSFIEASVHSLTKKDNKDNEKKFAKGEEDALRDIFNIFKQRVSAMPQEIKNFATEEIIRTVKGNSDKQMSLMSYYTRLSLGDNGKDISERIVVEMGLANIFFWTAFIIYDDFWDEDEAANPKVLPTANFFARDYIRFFTSLFNEPSDEFNLFFRGLMDSLDGANTWETARCRTKIINGKFLIPDILPDYKDYSQKYYPASGHILGPVAIFKKIGFKVSSEETQNLINYFKHYLIAMQLNDDMHDWEEDLKRGHLSTSVMELLKEYSLKYPDKKEIDIADELDDLRKTFWFNVMPKMCKETLNHTNKSEEALNKILILENPAPLQKFIDMNRDIAEQGLREYKNSIDLLNEFRC